MVHFETKICGIKFTIVAIQTVDKLFKKNALHFFKLHRLARNFVCLIDGGGTQKKNLLNH